MKRITFKVEMIAYDEHVTPESLGKSIKILRETETSHDVGSPGCEIINVSIDEIKNFDFEGDE